MGAQCRRQIYQHHCVRSSASIVNYTQRRSQSSNWSSTSPESSHTSLTAATFCVDYIHSTLTLVLQTTPYCDARDQKSWRRRWPRGVWITEISVRCYSANRLTDRGRRRRRVRDRNVSCYEIRRISAEMGQAYYTYTRRNAPSIFFITENE